MQSVYLQGLMEINTIGHLVKANPIQTQSNPVLSAVEWANFQNAKNERKLICYRGLQKKG